MNNSLKIDLDESFLQETINPDILREREAKLVRMIEALGALSKSKEWSTLKEELFEGSVESLERRQTAEASKPDIDLPALYRLQGQLIQAKRYELNSVLENSQRELANIRKQLNPPTAGERA